MGEPAIVVRGLRKSFGPKEAVAGIDLEIAAGSFAGLVGPNGAGKTTSLSMMTGLLRPDGGQVLINGLDVWVDPPAAKAIIGVVPAEARLFERLSGEELLEYAGRLRGLPIGEARSRAAQLLGVLDLTADAKRLVADYSTGMRKKATLGCALIHNPVVLFLDEPGIIAVPLLTLISFGLAAVARHPVDGFLAVAADLAGIGAALAFANVFTVTAPYPVERRAGSPVYGPASGYTAYRLGGTFGSLFGVALAVLPVVLAVVATRGDAAAVRMPVLVVCGAGYGFALAWAGVRIAAAAAGPKLPELYQIAARSTL